MRKLQASNFSSVSQKRFASRGRNGRQHPCVVPDCGTHHFYNELLDVLGRVVVLDIRVPHLARVRFVEGDSWTQKSQVVFMADGERRAVIYDTRYTRRVLCTPTPKTPWMSQWPKARPASRPMHLLRRFHGRRYVSISGGREIAGPW